MHLPFILVPSEAPSFLTVKNIGPFSAEISFTPPLQNTVNGILKGYEVLISDGHSSSNTSHINGTTHLLRNLKAFTIYRVQVAVVNNVGVGPKTPLAIFKTIESGKWI